MGGSGELGRLFVLGGSIPNHSSSDVGVYEMNRLWLTWFLAIVFFIVLGLSLEARGANLFAIELEDTVINITDDPCSVKAVNNLPQRAYRTEGGKIIEGCAGMNVFGYISIYFEDGSVLALPNALLKQLKSV
jgi:hypothetical protein